MKNNLIQLYLQNQARPRDLRVENNGHETTVYLYDVIGEWWGGVSAKQFVANLQGIQAETIHLRINSPGGDVFEARAIATALQQSEAKIVAHIDGIAASSASWIALAADEIEIAQGGFFMIHNSWSLAIGDKHEMAKQGGLLALIDKTIVADYARRTGKADDDLVAMMDAETWMEASDAVANGFADRVAEVSAKAGNWNLSAYSNVPKNLLEEPGVDNTQQVDREALYRRLNLCQRIAT